jgi:hypothetical protein
MSMNRFNLIIWPAKIYADPLNLILEPLRQLFVLGVCGQRQPSLVKDFEISKHSEKNKSQEEVFLLWLVTVCELRSYHLLFV